MMFRVDDLVQMSDVGKQEYKDCSSNPHNLEGTVIYSTEIFHPDNFPFRVLWANGCANSYRTVDLAPIKKDYKIEDFL